MKCWLIEGKTTKEERQICLLCPLPRCIYEFDGPDRCSIGRNNRRPHMTRADQAAVKKLAARGKTKPELQTLFGRSRRTIERVLR